MANRENYQRELDEIIERKQNVPTLLLHACCAPCSSYVLEYLSAYFSITVFYYNPNIYPEEEYERRVAEEERLIKEMGDAGVFRYPVHLLKGTYEETAFYEAVKGLEEVPEGGDRCKACFTLRLNEAARAAAEGGFDYLTTTLTISPLKNAEVLNTIGYAAAEKYGVSWLPSDFKKKNGYQRSLELSRTYGLYRQDYCGCVFSQREREKAKAERKREEENAVFDG